MLDILSGTVIAVVSVICFLMYRSWDAAERAKNAVAGALFYAGLFDNKNTHKSSLN